MRRILIAVVIFAVIELTMPLVALAQAQVDQQQEIETGSARLLQSYRLAQTFTPLIGGQLDAVWLQAHNTTYEEDYQATLSILDTSASGAPDDSATLASVDFDFPLTFGWFKVNLFGEDLFLEAEHLYSFVLTNDDSSTEGFPYGDEINAKWEDDAYPRGAAWQSEMGGPWTLADPFAPPGEADLTFRTTTIIPEPASAGVCGLAAFGGACLIRRRRR